MKKILILIIIAASTSLLINSCVNTEFIQGSGPIVNKTITLNSPFAKIISDVGYDIEITQGTTNNTAIEISGQSNLIDLVSFAVSENELVIKMKRDVNIMTNEPRKIKLQVANLESIKMLGDGDVLINSGLVSNKLNLSVMGNAHIECKAATLGRLDCGVSGNGTINFEDCTTQEALYALTGNGGINAFGNLSRKVKANVTGNGNIELNCIGDLDMIVTGNGDIQYKGTPNIIREVVTGNGSIDKK
jgi:hypothetical protein